MRKILLIFMFALATVNSALAQGENSQSASQTTKVSLNDVIEITFTATSADGATVTLPFSSVDDYTNGVESNEQEIRVRSNKRFNVKVQANSNKFTYTGSASPEPNMRVNQVLDMKIVSNNTGGSIKGGFSDYRPLSRSSKKILNNCEYGEKTFTIKYRATPGYSYPAGDYSAQIIFTATHD